MGELGGACRGPGSGWSGSLCHLPAGPRDAGCGCSAPASAGLSLWVSLAVRAPWQPFTGAPGMAVLSGTGRTCLGAAPQGTAAWVTGQQSCAWGVRPGGGLSRAAGAAGCARQTGSCDVPWSLLGEEWGSSPQLLGGGSRRWGSRRPQLLKDGAL